MSEERDEAPGGQPALYGADWDPLALLAAVRRSDLKATDAYVEEQREDIWRDLYAEYDARLFLLQIRRVVPQPGANFARMIDLWWEDERRHAQGFARLHSILFGTQAIDLYDELSLRRADFARLDPLLVDEFSILVVLAFDELVTCSAYRRDMGFYRGLDVPALEDWIRNLIRDEARHYANAVKVLRHDYRARLAEAPPLIDRLVALDSEPAPYAATFILDHFDENYGPALLQKCAAELKRVLASAADPAPEPEDAPPA